MSFILSTFAVVTAALLGAAWQTDGANMTIKEYFCSTRGLWWLLLAIMVAMALAGCQSAPILDCALHPQECN